MPTISTQTATVVSPSKVFIPHALGKLSVVHRGREFFVVTSTGSESVIENMDLSPL